MKPNIDDEKARFVLFILMIHIFSYKNYQIYYKDVLRQIYDNIVPFDNMQYQLLLSHFLPFYV